MSRGFVKEDDQELTPIVPPRASLPTGVSNYVTPHGLEELKQERESLLNQQASLIEDSTEKNRIQINFLSAKLNLLEQRIGTAKVVHLDNQPQEEVQFGATVKILEDDNKYFLYQIVGVDEANIAKDKISFLSPLAKVLLGKKKGDTVSLKTPKGNRKMQIKDIYYK